jgi:hypothetical protein
MSAVSGFGDLLQIPVRLPDLVSPEKRKQRLARRLSQLSYSLKKPATAKATSISLTEGTNILPLEKGGCFHFHACG